MRRPSRYPAFVIVSLVLACCCLPALAVPKRDPVQCTAFFGMALLDSERIAHIVSYVLVAGIAILASSTVRSYHAASENADALESKFSSSSSFKSAIATREDRNVAGGIRKRSSRCDDEGHLHLIFGPMFSGKSTELLRIVRRYEVASMKCMVVKYFNDTLRVSGSTDVVTHDSVSKKARAVLTLAEVEEEAKEFDVIGIDEAQFFPDVLEFVERQLNANKTVVVAGLDGTFQRKPFGTAGMLMLLPLCDSVIKLAAVCPCGANAPFSKRIVASEDVELIGGSESYVAACRTCYNRAATGDVSSS